MTIEEQNNLEIARRFLVTVGQGDPEENLAFYAEDVVQVEFPNRLVPQGATRDLEALRQAGQRGSKAVTGQGYEIVNMVASGDQVAVEVIWTATLQVPLGDTPVGGQMRARFAIFLTFRDGKIIRQHNYDCFDAF